MLAPLLTAHANQGFRLGPAGQVNLSDVIDPPARRRETELEGGITGRTGWACMQQALPARYGIGKALGPVGGDEANVQKHAILDGQSRGPEVSGSRSLFRG